MSQTSLTPGQRFREAVATEHPLQVVGTINANHALLAKRAGFKAIYLSGGGALLRGLAKRLTDKVNIKFTVAEDPLHAVARGTCKAIKNTDKYKFLMR